MEKHYVFYILCEVLLWCETCVFRRNANLHHVNGLLREQLDTATAANQSLTAELHKLMRMRDEFEQKEADWRKEERVSILLLRFIS